MQKIMKQHVYTKSHNCTQVQLFYYVVMVYKSSSNYADTMLLPEFFIMLIMCRKYITATAFLVKGPQFKLIFSNWCKCIFFINKQLTEIQQNSINHNPTGFVKSENCHNEIYTHAHKRVTIKDFCLIKKTTHTQPNKIYPTSLLLFWMIDHL